MKLAALRAAKDAAFDACMGLTTSHQRHAYLAAEAAYNYALASPLITLNAYHRIVAAGFDIEIKAAPTRYVVRLIHGKAVIATTPVVRNGTVSITQCLDKARNGRWGRTSAMGQLLVRYAELAESLGQTKNAA